MARLTLKSLKHDLDVLQAAFFTERAKVEEFIAAHSGTTTPAPPAPPPPSQDPNDPALFVQPVGNLNDPAFRDFLIARGLQVAYHRDPTPTDWDQWRQYWPGLVARGIDINRPTYAWDRLIGWQAEGADKAQFGPYR